MCLCVVIVSWEGEFFYEMFGECIFKVKGDSIIVLGDFNICVGKDW